ncbi:MAG TPA: carboxypeptidase-like regulatory domain-containing protein, partial [Longimicrobiales bacterium]|nr:carboxypeptidase-like regulatory domain-containing protein [Longimicrobiales bacterium]
AEVVADVWAGTGGRGSDTVRVEVPRDGVVVSDDVRLRPPPTPEAVPTPREAATAASLPPVAAGALAPADSIWLASKGFWLRGDETLLHETRREIAAEPGDTTLSQVVARAPGVEALLMASGGRELRLRPPDAAPSTEACRLDVYWNGRLARQREPSRAVRSRPRPTVRPSRARTWSASGLDLDGLVPVAGLTGIEVFEAAEAPVETSGGCGAVLLWMRGEALGDDPPFTGTLEGRVTCAAGGPLVSAPVTVEPGDTHLVTDGDGFFRIEDLSAAHYRVDVEVPVWGRWSTRVGLRAGSTARVEAEVEGGCG